jgi:hypothetical protein
MVHLIVPMRPRAQADIRIETHHTSDTGILANVDLPPTWGPEHTAFMAAGSRGGRVEGHRAMPALSKTSKAWH